MYFSFRIYAVLERLILFESQTKPSASKDSSSPCPALLFVAAARSLWETRFANTVTSDKNRSPTKKSDAAAAAIFYAFFIKFPCHSRTYFALLTYSVIFYFTPPTHKLCDPSFRRRPLYGTIDWWQCPRFRFSATSLLRFLKNRQPTVAPETILNHIS